MAENYTQYKMHIQLSNDSSIDVPFKVPFGPQGQQGAVGPTGPAGPGLFIKNSSTLGIPDNSLNITENGKLQQYSSQETKWKDVMSLKGTDGSLGPTGPTGIRGSQVFFSSTQPSSPVVNDIWVDNSTGSSYTLKKYNGSSWNQEGYIMIGATGAVGPTGVSISSITITEA